MKIATHIKINEKYILYPSEIKRAEKVGSSIHVFTFSDSIPQPEFIEQDHDGSLWNHISQVAQTIIDTTLNKNPLI